MATLLQFPKPKIEKSRKVIRATDNGERLDVITEDGERVVAKSRSTGKWHLLQKRDDGRYYSVGEA